MVLHRKFITSTNTFQKLKAFCLSAVLIISLLIDGHGMVSTGNEPMHGGQDTNPSSIKLLGTWINVPGTSVLNGITNAESSPLTGAAPHSNRLPDSREFCNTENAAWTEIGQKRQGAVQEDALKLSKTARKTRKGREEGSSASQNADGLSEAPLKNLQTQTSPSGSLQGNFDDSKSTIHGKQQTDPRDILARLTKVGKYYEEIWQHLKEKVNAWVSKVEKSLQENSSKNRFEEPPHQSVPKNVRLSIRKSMRRFLGVIVAWHYYEGVPVDSTILGNFLDSEEAYQSCLNTYKFWYDWLVQNRQLRQQLTAHHFHAFLRIIHDFGIENLKSAAPIRQESQETVHTLGSPHASIMTGKVREVVEIIPYSHFLVGEGAKLGGILDEAREAIQRRLEELKEDFKSEVNPSHDSTGEGTKTKHLLSDKGDRHSGLSTEMLDVMRRAEKNLLNRVLPGFFGWVEDMNRNFGEQTERKAILIDCLDYVIALISKWDKIELVNLIRRRTFTTEQGIIPRPRSCI